MDQHEWHWIGRTVWLKCVIWNDYFYKCHLSSAGYVNFFWHHRFSCTIFITSPILEKNLAKQIFVLLQFYISLYCSSCCSEALDLIFGLCNFIECSIGLYFDWLVDRCYTMVDVGWLLCHVYLHARLGFGYKGPIKFARQLNAVSLMKVLTILFIFMKKYDIKLLVLYTLLRRSLFT